MPRDDAATIAQMDAARATRTPILEAPPLRLVDPTTLEGIPVPARQWIIAEWLPIGYATANYADGGTGKTLLAQQLQTSCATGFAWCGMDVRRCRSLGFYGEDSDDELHRRQWDICHAFGLRFAELAAMRWISGVGQDNTLATFSPDGEMRPTSRFAEIRDAARDFGAQLVIIDTAADTFGGNENDRIQVRRFVGLLNRLAQEIGGAVLLNAHPSRSGLASGNIDGGSTAWSNSVRSRWSLAYPGIDEDAPATTHERILTRRKANYAALGAEIKLRWVNGVLIPAAAPGNPLAAVSTRMNCERVFLDLLARCDTSNFPVSPFNQSGNYAPKVFAKRPDANGYTRRDFERALSDLMAAGRITLENYGRKGDERRRIVLADQRETQGAEAAA